MNSESNRPLSVPTAEVVTALLRDGVDVRLRLAGWSMKPLFPSGVVVQFSSKPRPKVGDVVLIHHANDSLVAHRVVGLDDERVRTKGDSCLTEDAPVPFERVVACAVRREGRAFSLPLRSWWMRRIGLGINSHFPRLVVLYRAVVPRKGSPATGGGAPSC